MTEKKPKAPIALAFAFLPIAVMMLIFGSLFSAVAVEERLGAGAAFLWFPIAMGGQIFVYAKLFLCFDWK